MIKKDEGICFLTGVAGHFEGMGERIEIVLGKDDYWCLQGSSQQGELSGTAVALKFPNLSFVASDIKTYEFKLGNAPVRLISKEDGICALMGVAGAFYNEPNQSGLRLGSDNCWYIDMESPAAKARWLKAIVLKYPAEKE